MKRGNFIRKYWIEDERQIQADLLFVGLVTPDRDKILQKTIQNYKEKVYKVLTKIS